MMKDKTKIGIAFGLVWFLLIGVLSVFPAVSHLFACFCLGWFGVELWNYVMEKIGENGIS
jgi:hypothetical protein